MVQVVVVVVVQCIVIVPLEFGELWKIWSPEEKQSMKVLAA